MRRKCDVKYCAVMVLFSRVEYGNGEAKYCLVA
jgi:hypothetical protein